MGRKSLLAVFFILGCGSIVCAQTVTVNSSGGADFTSIQAAIDSIDPTNGEPDIIEIQDSAVYEEQVVLGGLPPIDSASGNFITDLVEQNRDPLILRGPESGEKPVIDPDPASLQAYGVFEDDLGDAFNAGVTFFGKGITVENVVIRQPGGNEAYGVNGQGVEVTFKNILFQPHTTTPEEDFINFNNSDRVAELFDGVGNQYLFEDCVFDGTREDDSVGEVELYYHGMQPSFKVVDEFVFQGCTFQNIDGGVTNLRARGADQQDSNQHMIDCLFIDNPATILNFSGGGEKVVDGCRFENNTNALETLPTEQNATVILSGRSGRTGELTITNSIFTNNASNGAEDHPGFDTWATVMVRNDGEDGDVLIDHCTFDGNGTAVRFLDPNTRPRTAVVSNSIFSNNISGGVSGDSLQGSYVESGNEDALDLTIENCLFHNNPVDFDIGSDSGTINADPLYEDTETFALQEDSPAIGAGTDGSDIGAVPSGPVSVGEFMVY